MPRPAKIEEATKQYKLLMTVSSYERLEKHAAEQQARSLDQVSVADLIRESIEIYLEALDDDDYEGGVGSSSGDGV